MLCLQDLIRLSAVTALATLPCLSVRAQDSFYNEATKSQFFAALSGSQTFIDFENAPLKPNTGTTSYNSGTGYFFSNLAGFQDQGVKFVGNGVDTSGIFGSNSAPNYLTADGPGYYNSPLQTNGTTTLQGPNSGSIQVTWNALGYPVTAFGTDLGNLGGGGQILVTLSSGDTHTFNASSTSAFSFFGVITDSPITEIDFEAQGKKYVQMDNVVVAQGVPETSTVVIMVLGLTIPGIRCLRQKADQQATVPHMSA